MSIHQKCKNMPTNNKPREDAIRCWYFVCWGFSAEHEKLVSLQLLHITNHYLVQMYLILVCVYCLLRSLKIHHGIPYSCIGAKSETSIGRQPKQISWKSDLSIFMIGKTSSIRIQLHNIIPCFTKGIITYYLTSNFYVHIFSLNIFM